MPVDIDESRLDDPAAMTALDPSGMLRATATAAAQLRESAAHAAEELGDRLAEIRPRALVICGMGGSGIAGELMAAVVGPGTTIPIVVHRGSGMPGWVGAADLVAAVSCSGRTRETLSAVGEAARRGAHLVGAGAAGSPLAELVAAGRGVFVPVTQVVSPRSSLWALAGPLLVLANRLGLLELGLDAAGLPAQLEAAAARLEGSALGCAPDRESFVNPAKGLALTLAGGLPLVWGTGQCGPVAALRLACQLAENAKTPAVSGALPEAHHNQVVCLDGVGAEPGQDDFFRDRVESPDSLRPQLILLRDDADSEAARLADVSREVAESRDVRVTELVAEGESAVERAASLTAIVDFASVYLALLRGLDPTPIRAIDDLKAKLAAAPA